MSAHDEHPFWGGPQPIEESFSIEVMSHEPVMVNVLSGCDLRRQTTCVTVVLPEETLRRIPDRRTCERFMRAVANQLEHKLCAVWEKHQR